MIFAQTESYLAEFLIKKNYTAYGIKRRFYLNNIDRIDHFYKHFFVNNPKLILHYNDTKLSLT